MVDGGWWDTALQKFSVLHKQPNKPCEGSFLAVSPTKCCQINSRHQFPSCWRFSVCWLLVSYHQIHLKSTHAIVDTRQPTK